MTHQRTPPKPITIWLAGLAAACFATATVTSVMSHHLVGALFSGLAAACFCAVTVLYARARGASTASESN